MANPLKNKTKAVFLDRDGTISKEVGYIGNVDDFELLADTVSALKILMDLGYKLVVVTNQSGVARGYFPEERVQEINRRMTDLLEREDIRFDGIYFCPHLEDGKIKKYAVRCACRKPETGMIRKAESELEIDLSRSWIIGDGMPDIKCGKNVGLKTILVRTGHGVESEKKLEQLPENEKPDYITDTLSDAVRKIKENNQ